MGAFARLRFQSVSHSIDLAHGWRGAFLAHRRVRSRGAPSLCFTVIFLVGEEEKFHKHRGVTGTSPGLHREITGTVTGPLTGASPGKPTSSPGPSPVPDAPRHWGRAILSLGQNRDPHRGRTRETANLGVRIYPLTEPCPGPRAGTVTGTQKRAPGPPLTTASPDPVSGSVPGPSPGRHR